MSQSPFTARLMHSNGSCLDYLWFEPQAAEGVRHPLVLFLHGAGERGSDVWQLLRNDEWLVFTTPERQPCYVLAPLCPEGESWNIDRFQRLLVAEIRRLLETEPVDPARVYVTGLSMGGMGTWALICRYPQLFAAALPICGGGEPQLVRAARHVPVWAFHAKDDPVVPVTGSFFGLTGERLAGTRTMVTALRGAGNRDVRYTEYPAGYVEAECGVGAHASWVPAYADAEALDWLFAQSRAARYEVDWLRPGLWQIDDAEGDTCYVVVGGDKALVIDTGMGDGDLIACVRELIGQPQLPLELALTHAHLDHLRHADRFELVYMSHAEAPVLDWSRGEDMLPDLRLQLADCRDIGDGDTIDLGGGVVIEVVELAGHTPGSLVFIDRAHGVLFTGDALGGWLQVPDARPLSEFRANLERFVRLLERPGYQDLVFLGGHRYQEGATLLHGEDYVANSPEKVRDLIHLIDLILTDRADVEPYPIGFGEQAYTASWGTANLVFNATTKR
ncbi:MAG: MBL fold metallo-hydrolase [Bacillota bacterium]|nr:MBL fold metallo-hydrolase [Bacillota bacterium]